MDEVTMGDDKLTADDLGALRVLVKCPGWGSHREVKALAKLLDAHRRATDLLCECLAKCTFRTGALYNDVDAFTRGKPL